MKKKITLENLAQMVAKGFIQMDKRFDSMEKKFKNRIDKLSDKTDRHFNNVDQRMDIIESDVKDIKYNRMHYAYVTDVNKLEKRVGVLEKKIS